METSAENYFENFVLHPAGPMQLQVRAANQAKCGTGSVLMISVTSAINVSGNVWRN